MQYVVGLEAGKPAIRYHSVRYYSRKPDHRQAGSTQGQSRQALLIVASMTLLCAWSCFVIQLRVMGSEGMDQGQVAAIVLAAGGSSRMGQPKQLLPLGGQPMVRCVVDAVCSAGLRQVLVVVGAHAQTVMGALAGLPVDIVVNPAWPEGMSTSLRAGLNAVRSEIRAVLIVLADQPALTPDLVQALLARYRTTGAPIVAPFYGGRRGNPVLFDRALFPELAALEGDQGGRLLLIKYHEQVAPLEIKDPALIVDVDTLQDYERIKESNNEDGSLV
jgi:molybdenum cofactor cytidylyltransferase